MSARNNILGRIRRQIVTTPSRQAEFAAHISDREPHAPLPAQARLSGAARIAQFKSKLKAVDATVSVLEKLDELPAALAVELRDRNLPAAFRHGSDPAFAALDWGGLDASTGVGRLKEPATLSKAFKGSAETGTLALLSGPDNPVTLTFLGETHFVVIHRADIVAGLDDIWTAFRESQLDPRTINLVTGPSRSADIGQKLQLGAHGPVALHVFVVG